jgi:hypothetical protein
MMFSFLGDPEEIRVVVFLNAAILAGGKAEFLGGTEIPPGKSPWDGRRIGPYNLDPVLTADCADER